MDEATAREHMEAHAKAVVDGDMDHVVADFAEELRPQVPDIAKSLPRPVTEANVESVELEGENGIAHIRYDGPDGGVTIRTVWEDRDGQPRIIEGAPVG